MYIETVEQCMNISGLNRPKCTNIMNQINYQNKLTQENLFSDNIYYPDSISQLPFGLSYGLSSGLAYGSDKKQYIKTVDIESDYFRLSNNDLLNLVRLSLLNQNLIPDNNNLNSIVNYETIIKSIKNITGKKHYPLLETLAEEIFQKLFLEKKIKKIKLIIEKLDIIKNTSSVGIEIEKSKLNEHTKR